MLSHAPSSSAPSAWPPATGFAADPGDRLRHGDLRRLQRQECQRHSPRHRGQSSALFRADARGADHQGPKGRGAPARRAQPRRRSVRRCSGLGHRRLRYRRHRYGQRPASATVKFRNSDTPTVVVLDLVKTGNDWRVGDITWQHEGKKENLRGLYRH